MIRAWEIRKGMTCYKSFGMTAIGRSGVLQMMSSMITKGLVIATAIDSENTNFIRTCIEAPLKAQSESSSCVMTDHTSGF